MGFLMTTESQVLSLKSHPKDGAFWLYSVPRHYTGVLGPTGTDQAQPSVGNQSWAAGWYDCGTIS